jgi:hypothetical protein
MLSLDAIAERRIREAQERGELDDLPGAGAPLALDDDALIPEDLRAAYRVLKNSGFLPPELDAVARSVRSSNCSFKLKVTRNAHACSPASIS